MDAVGRVLPCASLVLQWPDLCLMAILRDDADPSFSRVIGSIVCKLDYHKPKVSPQKCIRGYIAMLAVEKEWRGHGLGSTLARYAIETMTLKNCDEVVLETEITNSGVRLLPNLLDKFMFVLLACSARGLGNHVARCCEIKPAIGKHPGHFGGR